MARWATASPKTTARLHCRALGRQGRAGQGSRHTHLRRAALPCSHALAPHYLQTLMIYNRHASAQQPASQPASQPAASQPLGTPYFFASLHTIPPGVGKGASQNTQLINEHSMTAE